MGVRLTLILSGRAYEEHAFEVFPRLRIGRGEDCEVRIDNLGVSRLQCEIVNLGGVYQLRARSASQPTLVNGTRVETCNLQDGDGISFGKFTVAFSSDQAWSDSPRSVPAGDNTLGGATLGDAEAEARAREETLTSVRGYLCVGEQDVREARRVLNHAFCAIGKDPDCDVSLSGWTAPRMAALVVRDATGYRVLDVSPKGDSVLVNGQPRSDSRLSHGDRLTIRDQPLLFFSGNPPD